MNDYVMNMETHKLELHFEKEDYLALPEDLKKEINSNFFFSGKSNTWVSRAKFPNLRRAEEVAKKLGLTDGGKTGERLSFEEQMERKAKRAQERSERCELKSDQAAERGKALQKPAEDMGGDPAFFTQPLINSSAGKAFANERNRMFAAWDKGLEEFKKSEYYARKAETARRIAQGTMPTDKAFLDRKIKETERIIRAQRQYLENFSETYTGDEEIRFFPNEHFLDQQDEADKERITDTNFTVFGKVPKKYHVECESSLPDGRITIRLFEYDAQIALDEGEVTEETLTVAFPNTAVLYLRTYKKTPDKMKYVIVTPGGTVQYDVPIMKVQTYSLDDIFGKGLLMLIPFYIFSRENSFPEYNSNEQKLAELKAEYQKILERLDELEQQGVIGAFDKRTIIELSGDVIKEIAQKYENVQKGVGDIMGGALIETEARRILNKGISETKKETALRMLKRGKMTVEEIAEDSGLSVAEVTQLAELQSV